MVDYHGAKPPSKFVIQKDTPQEILKEEAERLKDDDDQNDFRIK